MAVRSNGNWRKHSFVTTARSLLEMFSFGSAVALFYRRYFGLTHPPISSLKCKKVNQNRFHIWTVHYGQSKNENKLVLYQLWDVFQDRPLHIEIHPSVIIIEGFLCVLSQLTYINVLKSAFWPARQYKFCLILADTTVSHGRRLIYQHLTLSSWLTCLMLNITFSFTILINTHLRARKRNNLVA